MTCKERAHIVNLLNVTWSTFTNSSIYNVEYSVNMLPNKTLETISKILIRHYALEISTMIVIDIITYTNTYTQNIHMHRMVN